MTGYKNPPLRRTPEIQLQRCNANLAHLAEKYRNGQSWDAIGAEIGLSGPVVYRAVVQGKIPRKKAARRALGLLAYPGLHWWPRKQLARAIRERVPL